MGWLEHPIPHPAVKRNITHHFLLHRVSATSGTAPCRLQPRHPDENTSSSSPTQLPFTLPGRREPPLPTPSPGRQAPAESRQRGGPRRWGRPSNMAEQPQSHQSHQSQALGAGSEGCKALAALLSGIAQAAYHGNAALTAELLRGQLYPEAAPEEFAALRAKMGGLLQVPPGAGVRGGPHGSARGWSGGSREEEREIGFSFGCVTPASH